MQVNKTLTKLDLMHNLLGSEGGKAIAKSLQVTFPFLLSALFSMTSNVCVCVFLLCLLFSHAGKQDADQSGFDGQQAWPAGRKSYRPIAPGDFPRSLSYSLFCHIRCYCSMTGSQYYIAMCMHFFCAGEHKHQRTRPQIQRARRRGGQSSGKGSGGKSNLHCHRSSL